MSEKPVKRNQERNQKAIFKKLINKTNKLLTNLFKKEKFMNVQNQNERGEIAVNRQEIC